jgi:hypothetical protein
MIEHGAIDIGLGRKNTFDDDKGLPDGVVDNQPWHISFSLSAFLKGDRKTEMSDIEQNARSLLITHFESVYDFERQSISFKHYFPLDGEVLNVIYGHGSYYAIVKLEKNSKISFRLIEL